jgi:spore coat polysaccharide biosynthesis protein SpsF
MNLVVITARTDSSRLPNKALLNIVGVPNLLRIVRRFQKCAKVDCIIVATSDEPSDDPIDQFCKDNKIAIYRGSKNDVLARVKSVADIFAAKLPLKQKFDVRVLRATTDCPFISWNLVDLAFDALAEFRTHSARVWGAPDRMVPVYGASEMPVSYLGIEQMDKQIAPTDPLREHCFADIDAHRLQYSLSYLAAPAAYNQTFYAPYRLELDTPDDLEMVGAVIKELGDEPPLERVIRFLDAHPEIARLNADVSEKTGPLTSYTPEQRAEWRFQQNANTQEWRGDWTWLSIPSMPKGARALFCKRGTCYVGYIDGLGRKAKLIRPDGTALFGKAELPCACGAGRVWHEAK